MSTPLTDEYYASLAKVTYEIARDTLANMFDRCQGDDKEVLSQVLPSSVLLSTMQNSITLLREVMELEIKTNGDTAEERKLLLTACQTAIKKSVDAVFNEAMDK